MEAAGDAGGTVHKPVAALNQAQQTHDKQQNRDQHNISPFFQMMAAEAQKKDLYHILPGTGKCDKSLKHPVLHRAFLPGLSLQHSAPVFNQDTPLTPFYPENIIPVFRQKRKGKYGIYSALITFLALG